MRSLYGTRSIIPNNYYFTFDKIYQKINDVIGAKDDIMIGRTILCQEDNTVWLKTVSGYIRVAKLDNEGRFKFLEGYSLKEGDNIDDLGGLGISLNGNGTYIVDYGKIIKGTFPTIKGMSQANYLEDTVFLLNQYSGIPGNKNFVEIPEGADYSSNILYYEKNDNEEYNEIVLTLEDYNTAISSGKTFYQLNNAIVTIYQIMTDISSTSKDKKDVDDNRQTLYHNNKSFVRNIKYQYKLYTEELNANEIIAYYKYDISRQGFQQITELPESKNGLYIRVSEEKWSEWFDLSEQYIGYLGYLGKTDKITNNLTTASNIVEALNIYDQIIGTSKRISNKGDEPFVNSVDSDEYLSKSLTKDSRSYKIPEENIIDALVRQSADIGNLSKLQNINNISFSTTEQFNSEDDWVGSSATTINSLTDAIMVLNKLIGDGTSIGGKDDKGVGIASKNVIAALHEHDSEIGELSKLDKTNGLKEIVNLVAVANKLNNLIGNINSLNEDDNAINRTNLVESINTLNNLIGVVNKIDGQNDLSTTNIVENINKLNKLIGNIQNLSNVNEAKKSDLVESINTLNSTIGDKNELNIASKSTFTEAINSIIDTNKNQQTMIAKHEELYTKLSDTEEQIEETRQLINNLAENINILSDAINMHAAGGSIETTWGSF